MRDGRGSFKDEWLSRWFRRGEAFTYLFKILLGRRACTAKIEGHVCYQSTWSFAAGSRLQSGYPD